MIAGLAGRKENARLSREEEGKAGWGTSEGVVCFVRYGESSTKQLLHVGGWRFSGCCVDFVPARLPVNCYQ